MKCRKAPVLGTGTAENRQSTGSAAVFHVTRSQFPGGDARGGSSFSSSEASQRLHYLVAC